MRGMRVVKSARAYNKLRKMTLIAEREKWRMMGSGESILLYVSSW